eukprot:1476153-Rhodomonas_salina.1
MLETMGVATEGTAERALAGSVLRLRLRLGKTAASYDAQQGPDMQRQVEQACADAECAFDIKTNKKSTASEAD